MDAVLLGALAGALFGAMAVAVRGALARAREPVAGSFVIATVGCALAGVLALVTSVEGAAFAPREVWPFALAGVVVPGLSQILFVRAVRDAGASRTGIVLGAAPLISALVAVVVLGETLTPALLVGTVAIVAGASLIAWERKRPAEFRAVGLAVALAAAALFGTRDNVVRWAAVDTDVRPLAATTVSLAAAAAVLLAAVLVSGRVRALGGRLRRSALPFLPAGILLGLAYPALFEALDRGPVTVVAPLNGTQALWAVLLVVVVAGRSEAIGARVVLAALLVVVGSAVIGVSR